MNQEFKHKIRAILNKYSESNYCSENGHNLQIEYSDIEMIVNEISELNKMSKIVNDVMLGWGMDFMENYKSDKYALTSFFGSDDDGVNIITILHNNKSNPVETFSVSAKWKNPITESEFTKWVNEAEKALDLKLLDK